MSTTTSPAGWRGEPLTMGQLGAVLLRHWILLIVGLLVGALAGYAAAQFVPKVFTATSTLLVKAVPGTSPTANYEAAQFAVARAKAYPTLLYNLSVLEGVRSDLGTSESVVDLRQDITATTVTDTPLVQIAAQGPTAGSARDKANAAARQLSRFVLQIEAVNGKSPISVEVAVAAGSPQNATSPRPLLYAALGGVAGLALAIAVALIHAYAASIRQSNRPRRRQRGSRASADLDEPSPWDDTGHLEQPQPTSGSIGERSARTRTKTSP